MYALRQIRKSSSLSSISDLKLRRCCGCRPEMYSQNSWPICRSIDTRSGLPRRTEPCIVSGVIKSFGDPLHSQLRCRSNGEPKTNRHGCIKHLDSSIRESQATKTKSVIKTRKLTIWHSAREREEGVQPRGGMAAKPVNIPPPFRDTRRAAMEFFISRTTNSFRDARRPKQS